MAKEKKPDIRKFNGKYFNYFMGVPDQKHAENIKDALKSHNYKVRIVPGKKKGKLIYRIFRRKKNKKGD